MTYKFSRKELKTKKVTDFVHGDVIICNKKYYIHIRYRDGKYEYDNPSLLSYVTTREGETLDCTPVERPYYIEEFIYRKEGKK
jgi:hypothetical protein